MNIRKGFPEDRSKDFLIDDDEFKQYFIKKSYEWLIDLRNSYRKNAREFTREEKAVLQPYFEPELLDFVRIEFVESIENPPFYSEILELGLENTLDFRNAVGLTLIDCILALRFANSNPQFLLSLLFHEMVHVAQCQILGAENFLELYINSWAANSYDYGRIVFEKQAYDLQIRFDEGEKDFNVIEILKRNFRSNKDILYLS